MPVEATPRDANGPSDPVAREPTSLDVRGAKPVRAREAPASKGVNHPLARRRTRRLCNTGRDNKDAAWSCSPHAPGRETRRRHADTLKCAQRREKEVGKGKAWGPKTLLERAEMHAGAFVQVTAGQRLWCSTSIPRCSALSTSSCRCSALRFCSLSVAARRWHFLGETLGDARFVPLSSFR